MRYFTALAFFSLVAFFSGCGEPKADISSPKSHRSGDLVFSYPKNWKIDEDMKLEGFQTIFIETPGEAIVILQSFPKEDSQELMDYAEEFSVGAASETPIGQIVDVKLTQGPQANGYEWVTESFKVNLLGESLSHQRVYGSKDIGEKRVVLIFQVASEDAGNVQAGFDLVRDTLQLVEGSEQDD